MRIYTGDTVILVDDPRTIGIVEHREDDTLTVRFPDTGNKREHVPRKDIGALAEAIYEARKRGTKYGKKLSLTGGSTLAELVWEFGYATSRLRSESLDRVVRQLQRAGLEVHPETDRWNRDDRFKVVVVVGDTFSEVPEPGEDRLRKPQPLPVDLPYPFWPTALGLDPIYELAFLKALTTPDPILALLNLPEDSDTHSWLQATWEGLMSWAYHSAQRFHRGDLSSPEVLVGPPAMLQSYFGTSLLGPEVARLRDKPHSLNLVTLKRESDRPVELLRLRAAWPGPVFDFRPQPAVSGDAPSSEDVRALLECLLLIAGSPTTITDSLSPLKTLLWSKEACRQILVRASSKLGDLLSSGEFSKFKGSNESGTALALKADLARWIKETYQGADLRFEENQIQEADDLGNRFSVSRIDLFVEGQGRFEVETMIGSGPMEAFYHQKVFARAKRDGTHLWLIVPNETVLWAGPYLTDLAHHLGSLGSVLIPGFEDAYLKVKGKPIAVKFDVPWNNLSKTAAIGEDRRPEQEGPLRLKDVAGYKEIRERVDEEIIWPEKHRWAMRRPSGSSGILFFGPPGCGKSRVARAIAGELEQEVRLLGPSDLRGLYVGWGQIMIREQFDWVAERERRMLVIDEFDAVARSRSEIGNMHSDEKANVNELLVQLDRVSRLGRLIVATTNFVESLDEAVVRSGRFGRFVPVPPPGIDEAIDILNYHLKALVSEPNGENLPRVQVPEAQELRSVLEPLFQDNVAENQFFCGADLKEAVDRTYRRCLRQAVGDTWPDDSARVNVNLTSADLTCSLKDVSRSVTGEAFGRFIKDVKRYCGRSVAEQFSRRLTG